MDEEIDITADLDGTANEGALGDVAAQGAGVVQPNQEGAQQARPDGAVPVNIQPDKAAEKEYSLRDQLSSAFKGNDAPATEGTQATQAETPTITKDADGKYRNADGTFASAEQVAAFEAAQKPAVTTDTNTQTEAPAYLSRMTPVEQTQFQALPAEIREFVGRTMEAVEVQAARFNEYGLIEQQLLGPRREAWAANGMTPAVALQNLLNLSDNAARDPKAFVLWFADQHKIDLDAALDERDSLQSQDPQVRALMGEVQQLRNQVQQSQAGSVQAQQEASQRDVETFAQEKDGAGKLVRPYLTDVMDTWPVHIQAIRAANPLASNAEVLQKAYEAACWGNANVRARMQEAVQAEQRAAAAAKAAAAKAAGSSVTGAASGRAPGTPDAANNNRSIRQDLQAAFAEHS